MINLSLKSIKNSLTKSLSLTPKPNVSKKALVVIILAALCLVFIRYLTGFDRLVSFLEVIHLDSLGNYFTELRNNTHDKQLFDLIYWTACRVFFYLIIPVLVIKIFMKKRMSDFGWRLSDNLNKDLKIFVVFFCFMFPLVFWVSTQDSFLLKYPFYRPASAEQVFPNLLIWELFYFLQFVSLEFFFRGFVVHGLKEEIGDYSVLVMIIPYCMIHFGKPMPETFAAIFAGIILGFMSLKTRSIWMGAALHVTVALTMDTCALWRAGKFF